MGRVHLPAAGFTEFLRKSRKFFIYFTFPNYWQPKSFTVKTRIAIADDHHLVREALAVLIESSGNFEVSAQAATGEEALHILRFHKSDILLLDLSMPGMNGFDVLRAVQYEKLPVKVLVLSAFDSPEYIAESMKLGACGFLSKSIHTAELSAALYNTVEHGFYFSQSTGTGLLKEVSRLRKMVAVFNEPVVHFSQIQMQVLYHHCCDRTNAEIGQLVFASTRTVEGIKGAMCKMLGVKGFMSVVMYACQKGLIDPNSIPIRRRPEAA